jgi:hypothetical protein
MDILQHMLRPGQTIEEHIWEIQKRLEHLDRERAGSWNRNRSFLPPTTKENSVTNSSIFTGSAVNPCSQENAGYGENWTYRAFSQIWHEPDCPESGRRYLTLRKVWPTSRRCKLPDYPVEHEIAVIGSEDECVTGFSIDEMESTVERMRQAFHKPALILAEWEHLAEREYIPSKEETASGK